MSSEHISDRIVRTNDGELVSTLLEIATSEIGERVGKLRLGFTSGLEPLEVPRNEWSTDEKLQGFAERRSRIIRSASLFNTQGQNLVDVQRQITRPQNDQSQLFDTLTLYPQHFDGDGATFARFAEKVQDSFRVSKAGDLGALLGPDVEKHFAAREEALNRLELLVTEQNRKLDARREELDEQQAERLADLEQKFSEREQALDAEHAARSERLAAAEKELEERTKEIDNRAATHARRDDRKQLLEAITQENRLAVSAETKQRRTWVLAGYGGLLLFFIVVTGWLFYLGTSSSSGTDYFLIGSRIAATVGTIVTAGFFIRWLNDFASKSAAEDFKLKQLQLDVQRASWLVELYFESLEAGDKTEFPSELLDRLSRNLFHSEDVEPDSVTASDALASAILGAAGKLRLNVAGNEIEFSKQGLRKLKRKRLRPDSSEDD